jgi:hypothetical protein
MVISYLSFLALRFVCESRVSECCHYVEKLPVYTGFYPPYWRYSLSLCSCVGQMGK